MCSEQEPHRVTATPSKHALTSRVRCKYCRSGIDPFGEPGPLVLPADATHRNQRNLTWPATYNEPLLEYYVPLPRCPSGAWTSGLGPQSRPSGSGADRGWAVLVPSSFGSLGPNGQGHAPADAKGLSGAAAAIAAAIPSRASFSGEADRENWWTSVPAGDQR